MTKNWERFSLRQNCYPKTAFFWHGKSNLPTARLRNQAHSPHYFNNIVQTKRLQWRTVINILSFDSAVETMLSCFYLTACGKDAINVFGLLMWFLLDEERRKELTFQDNVPVFSRLQHRIFVGLVYQMINLASLFLILLRAKWSFLLNFPLSWRLNEVTNNSSKSYHAPGLNWGPQTAKLRRSEHSY